LVNQEWPLVNHVMLDSMMPLDDGVITKQSPIKIATSFNFEILPKNPKFKTLILLLLE
jgi:hypothetical protein